MNIFKKFLVVMGLFLTAWVVPAQQGLGGAAAFDDELTEDLFKLQVESSGSGSSVDLVLPGEVDRSYVPTPLSQRASSLRALGSDQSRQGLLGSLESLPGSGASPSHAWIGAWMSQTSRRNASSAPAAVGTRANPIVSSCSLDDLADLEEALFAEADFGQEAVVMAPSLGDSAVSASVEELPVLADRSLCDSVVSTVSPASRFAGKDDKFLEKLAQQKARCLRCVDRHSFVKETGAYYKMLYRKINSPLDSELFIRHNQKIIQDSVEVAMYGRREFLKNEVVAIDRLIQCLYRGITPPEMQEVADFLTFYGKEDVEGPLADVAKLQCAVFARLAECAASPEVVWNQPEAWLFSREAFDEFRERHAAVMAGFKNVVVKDLEIALKRYHTRELPLEDWNDHGPAREFCEGVLRHPVVAATVVTRVTWYGLSMAAVQGCYHVYDAAQSTARVVGNAARATGQNVQAAARACAAPVDTIQKSRGRRGSFDLEDSCERDRQVRENRLFRKIKKYCKENETTLNAIPLKEKRYMLAEWRHIKSLKDARYRHAFLEASERSRPFSDLQPEFVRPVSAVGFAMLAEESVVDEQDTVDIETFLNRELELLGDEAVC